MYQNVYFQGVKRRPVNQQQNNNYADNPFNRTDYKQFNEISTAVNSAIYAYASPIIQKPYEKMSLNDNILRLKKEGKIEGKDYTIDGCTMGNLVLYINNKDGHPLKVLHYDNGDIDHVNCYQNYQYQNGKEVKCHNYDWQNKLFSSTDTYYNDETPQEQFTDAHITYRTTPVEYLSYLKSKNADYKVEKESKLDYNRVKITEFDDSGNKKSKFVCMKFNDGHAETYLDEYNEQEELVKSTIFTQHRTQICNYFEKRKMKFIPKDALNQENFTKEHISAYTKPDEYVRYLEQNAIKYKIDNIDCNETQRINVTEYDKYDRKYQSTCFEKSGEPGVMREFYELNGDRKRYEFQPEGTYVTTFRY